MKVENLKIGNVYFVEGLGEGVYMGRLNMDIMLDDDKRKGNRIFKMLGFKGSGLMVVSKREIEREVEEIN